MDCKHICPHCEIQRLRDEIVDLRIAKKDWVGVTLVDENERLKRELQEAQKIIDLGPIEAVLKMGRADSGGFIYDDPSRQSAGHWTDALKDAIEQVKSRSGAESGNPLVSPDPCL